MSKDGSSEKPNQSEDDTSSDESSSDEDEAPQQSSDLDQLSEHDQMTQQMLKQPTEQPELCMMQVGAFLDILRAHYGFEEDPRVTAELSTHPLAYRVSSGVVQLSKLLQHRWYEDHVDNVHKVVKHGSAAESAFISHLSAPSSPNRD